MDFKNLFLIIFFSKSISADQNLILITIDTLRADHLVAYGYKRNTSPNITNFAKDSIVFDNHITTRPKTGPSLASLFTGLYPNQHGVRQNRQALNPKHRVLTTAFKENGYQTFAVVSNLVLKPEYSGLQRDFDIYDVNLNEAELNRENIKQRNAENTFKAALDILKKVKLQKFFIWIHLIDPHGPYYPPPENQDYFKSNLSNFIPKILLPQYQILPKAPVINKLTDLNYYIDSYDDEIKYTDVHFGKFIKEIEALEIDKNSLIIISSDHGESLDNHNYYLEHGDNLYDSSIKIPLIIKTPEMKFTSPNRYQGVSTILDIYPTLINYFNFNFTKESDGKDLFELIKNSHQSDRIVFSENVSPINYKVSARSQNKKVIKFKDQLSCFDLRLDPAEINPNSCDNEKYHQLTKALNDYLRLPQSNLIKNKTTKVDTQDIKTLKSLGYF